MPNRWMVNHRCSVISRQYIKQATLTNTLTAWATFSCRSSLQKRSKNAPTLLTPAARTIVSAAARRRQGVIGGSDLRWWRVPGRHPGHRSEGSENKAAQLNRQTTSSSGRARGGTGRSERRGGDGSSCHGASGDAGSGHLRGEVCRSCNREHRSPGCGGPADPSSCGCFACRP